MLKMNKKVQTLLLTFLLLIVSAFGFLAESETADAATKDFYGNYISLSIKDKANGKWIIAVKNPQSYAVTIEYNEKMCFGNDAAAWNDDLKDVESIYLNSQAQSEVTIKENGFAGYIAFSFVSDGMRYITYAHNLNSSKKTMTILNVSRIEPEKTMTIINTVKD